MQIFPRSLNKLPAIAAAAAALGLGGAVFVVTYYFSPWNTQVGYAPKQPVPYSHRLHAGELGIDCRYCHANVERAGVAQIPPTQTCMNCHTNVQTKSAKLAPVRESWCSTVSASEREKSNRCANVDKAVAAALPDDKAVEWVKIHKLADHAYFDHSAHVSAGVGCESCHGRVDQMEVVRQVKPLSMGWCLECHRNPEPNLRPLEKVTAMGYQADPSAPAKKAREVNPPQHCSGCHR
jgi:hypothetical protein